MFVIGNQVEDSSIGMVTGVSKGMENVLGGVYETSVSGYGKFVYVSKVRTELSPTRFDMVRKGVIS